MEKERISNAIETVRNLEKKYDLPGDEIEIIEEDFKDFRVYVPLLGRFSAGKSALINNLLGYGREIEICKEDIQVATALPAEIFYGEKEEICICRPHKETVTTSEYLDMRDGLSSENAEIVKIQLENEVLGHFPHIALVDMPGLDSGYEVHEKVIENYIKKSMAFALVFPADELTIPETMSSRLHELNDYDMPVCAVITKGDRLEGDREERSRQLKRDLSKYFGDRDIPIFLTEAETGALGGFVKYLTEMEERAGELGGRHYKRRLEPEFARIVNFLSGYLKNMELSLSEIEEEQERLEHDMAKLNCKVSEELDELSGQIPDLVDQVAMDVQAALSNQLEELVFDLVHDSDVTAAINKIVQETLNSSYQNRVMEKIKKHLNKIEKTLSLESANYASAMMIDLNKACGKEISDVGRTAIDVIGLLIGGPLGAIIAHVLTGLFNQSNDEKRREAEARVRRQLTSQVFPEVDREVREKLEMDLERISMEIRETVKKDVDLQIASLKQSLDQVIARREEEDEQKAQRREEIEQDMRLLEEVQWDAE